MVAGRTGARAATRRGGAFKVRLLVLCCSAPEARWGRTHSPRCPSPPPSRVPSHRGAVGRGLQQRAHDAVEDPRVQDAPRAAHCRGHRPGHPGAGVGRGGAHPGCVSGVGARARVCRRRLLPPCHVGPGGRRSPPWSVWGAAPLAAASQVAAGLPAHAFVAYAHDMPLPLATPHFPPTQCSLPPPAHCHALPP